MSSDMSLKKHLSPLGAWAFAVGSSVGWGSLVVTSNTYLTQAGPLGSVLGLIAGAVVMLIISRNYSYMMKCYPDAGGIYAYSKEILGYDFGFLLAWFLSITYFAILWANVTSLPLFARIFFGGFFRFGKLYSLFGYDVYIGEVLLSIAAVLLIGFICSKSKKLIAAIMIGLVCLFACAIAVCFFAAIGGHGGPSLAPAYVPDSSALSQIIKIAIISPWAFIGFENISHGTEEFSFPLKKIHLVLVIAVLTTLILYIMVTLLSVTAIRLNLTAG